MNILLIDDHAMLREALQFYLPELDSTIAVATAGSLDDSAAGILTPLGHRGQHEIGPAAVVLGDQLVQHSPLDEFIAHGDENGAVEADPPQRLDADPCRVARAALLGLINEGHFRISRADRLDDLPGH